MNVKVQCRRYSSRLRGAKRLSGVAKTLKLSTKAAVFKRVSLLIGEAKHVDWGMGGQAPLGAGPVKVCLRKCNTIFRS